MTTKEIINEVWRIESKYNKGKRFCFWQDFREALNKEIKDAEENGMYYKAFENLCWLKKEVSK